MRPPIGFINPDATTFVFLSFAFLFIYEPRLFDCFSSLMNDIREERFSPEIIYDDKGNPVEFAALHLSQYEDLKAVHPGSISLVLERFYAEKNRSVRIKQRSADLRKIVSTLIERDSV